MASNWIDRRVVVTGLGVVTPLGQQMETFWANLLAGGCGIDKITAFDPSGFDCQIPAEIKDFHPGAAFPSPKERKRTGRFPQLAVCVGINALLASGLDLEKLN